MKKYLVAAVLGLAAMTAGATSGTLIMDQFSVSVTSLGPSQDRYGDPPVYTTPFALLGTPEIAYASVQPIYDYRQTGGGTAVVSVGSTYVEATSSQSGLFAELQSSDPSVYADASASLGQVFLAPMTEAEFSAVLTFTYDGQLQFFAGFGNPSNSMVEYLSGAGSVGTYTETLTGTFINDQPAYDYLGQGIDIDLRSIVTPIPEPSTWALLAGGLLFAAYRRVLRRR